MLSLKMSSLLKLVNAVLMLSFNVLAFDQEFKISSTTNIYKSYHSGATWHEAWRTCRADGGEFFVPESNREKIEVLSALPHSQDGYGPWIGVSNLPSRNYYESISGTPIYVVTNPANPPRANNDPRCALMWEDGTLVHDECSRKLIFVCKFTPKQ